MPPLRTHTWTGLVVVLVLVAAGCAPDEPDEPTVRRGCVDEGTPGATAGCLGPKFDDAYYVDEALKYFDTLDVEADRDRVPEYSELVARWEWPPWLLLTAFDRETMHSTANSLRSLDPSTVPTRDCRAFPEQPFARCYIVFEYEEGPCPIYEEFTFNDQGETTWIEAWSDLPGHLPFEDPNDRWGEGATTRLGTRVPGLGNATGRVDLESEWMMNAAAADADVADFALRASDQWFYWYEEYKAADEDFFAKGCGWE